MLLNNIFLGTNLHGYIGGTESGIVTAGAQSAARNIWLLDVKTMAVLKITSSLDNGHYLFVGLDPDKRYLVMARDYKKEYEPFVWDYVKPADDLTIAEQQALWQSWQTK